MPLISDHQFELSSRHFKIIIIYILLAFTILNFVDSKQLTYGDPYFYRRLAALNYQLLPPGTDVTYREPLFPGVNESNPIGLTALFDMTFVSALVLATTQRVTGSELLLVPHYPLMLFSTASASYLLTRQFTSKTAALGAALLSSVMIYSFPHFHDYVFGRHIFYPLIIVCVVKIAVTARSSVRRWFAIFPIFLFSLKFSAPGTEAVVVFTVISLLVLSYFLKDRLTIQDFGWHHLFPVAVLVFITFFIYNPKLYYSIFGGAHLALEVGSSESGFLSQLRTAAYSIYNMISGSGTERHPLEYSDSRPFIVLLLRRIFIFSLILFMLTYILFNSVKYYFTKKVEHAYVIVVSILVGIATNATLRGILLDEIHPKGLFVITPIIGTISAYKYVKTEYIVITSLILFSIFFSAVVFESAYEEQRSFQVDHSASTAEWQIEYQKGNNVIFTDWNTWPKLAYFYADNGVSKYWEKYEFYGYTVDNYEKLIAGNFSKSNYDYFILNEGEAHKGTKPQEWGELDPIEPYKGRIVTENQMNNIFDNGEYDIYI